MFEVFISRRSGLRRVLFALAFLLLFISVNQLPVRGATPDNWLTATSGDWTDSNNWSAGVYPTAGTGTTYDATIAATGADYVVTLNSDVTLNSLTLNSPAAELSQLSGTLTSGTFNVGNGTFTQTGGTNVPSDLYLEAYQVGDVAGGGTYNLQGGTLEVGIAYINYSAGTLSPSGICAVNQSGGYWLFDNVRVEPGATTVGQFNLSGGTFQGFFLQVEGSNASFNQSGGTASIISMWVLSGGTATLSGGTLDAFGVSNDGVISASAGVGSFSNILGTGTLILDSGASNGPASITVEQLFVQSALIIKAGLATFPPSTATQQFRINSLQISGTGRLDLTSNGLVIDYSGLSDPIGAATGNAGQPYPAGTVNSFLHSAFDAKTIAFDGPGLGTSAVLPGSTPVAAVGAIDNAALPGAGLPSYTTFADQPVPSTAVLVRYTYFGDANLDGKVDGTDFQLFELGYLGDLPASWLSGDFNYDGKVDGADFQLIELGYLFQGAQLTDDSIMGPAPLAVPEPALALALPAVLLIRRRGRS